MYGRNYDYAWAAAEMATARNPDNGKPVCNNTRLFRRNGAEIALRLHSTDVVNYHPGGTYVLDSGGWRTMTTAQRIRQYSPAKLVIERGQWYIRTRPTDEDPEPNYADGYRAWQRRNRVPFTDGIQVDSEGFADRDSGPDAATVEAHEKTVRATKKACREYARGFVAELQRGMPEPNNGDCWGCLFALNAGGDPLGTDHLRDHLDEAYYVPSLAVNALREEGRPEVGIGMILGATGQGTMGGSRGMPGLVERSIYKYLTKRLVPVLT